MLAGQRKADTGPSITALPQQAETTLLGSFGNFEKFDKALGSQKAYCTYYASAMAIMLRAQGIPARIVNGYVQGDYDETTRSYRVRASNARSGALLLFNPDTNRLEQWLRRNVVPQWSAAAARDFSAQPALARTLSYGDSVEYFVT